jgi:hypothetical protein
MKTTPDFRELRRSPAWALSLAFLVVALLSPFGAAAGERPKEKPYALIFGTVWDPDGHPVYGVKVKIRRADEKRTRWELYSNHTGEFAQRLPVGKADYVISADLKGFKSPPGKHLRPGAEVTVHVDNEERADVGLHLIW